MLTIDGVLRLWLSRERDAGPVKARDRETLEMFDGRMAVPLTEMDGLTKSAVANLLAQGVTAKAQRIASTRPAASFPAGPSKASQKRAREKRKALVGMWDENRLHLQRRQRARWLVAYATAPVIVRPTWRNGQWGVVWEPRSALSAYPAHFPPVRAAVPWCVTGGIHSYRRDRAHGKSQVADIARRASSEQHALPGLGDAPARHPSLLLQPRCLGTHDEFRVHRDLDGINGDEMIHELISCQMIPDFAPKN